MHWNTCLVFVLAIGLFPACGCSENSGTNLEAPLYKFPKDKPSDLETPISVIEGHLFSDFGSVGIRLRSSNGKETYLFFSQNEWENADYIGGRLYVGLPSSTTTSYLVPENGKEQNQIAKLLEHAIRCIYHAEKSNEHPSGECVTVDDSIEMAAAKEILNAIQNGAVP